MAVVTLPFFTVFWVTVVTAIGLALIIIFVRALRSSGTNVEQSTNSAK